jgi:hypothetical protein
MSQGQQAACTPYTQDGETADALRLFAGALLASALQFVCLELKAQQGEATPMPRILPFTKTELDIMVTMDGQYPSCDRPMPNRGLWFQARCHPSAGLEAHYCDGVLTLSCLRCRRPLASIAVAAEGSGS